MALLIPWEVWLVSDDSLSIFIILPYYNYYLVRLLGGLRNM